MSFKKKERQEIVHNAANRIATGKEWFSCHALRKAQYLDFTDETDELSREYKSFYDLEEYSNWVDDLEKYERPNARLMLLAWYAEVGPEGIK